MGKDEKEYLLQVRKMRTSGQEPEPPPPWKGKGRNAEDYKHYYQW